MKDSGLQQAKRRGPAEEIHLVAVHDRTVVLAARRDRAFRLHLGARFK